jgi:hypothetical protein
MTLDLLLSVARFWPTESTKSERDGAPARQRNGDLLQFGKAAVLHKTLAVARFAVGLAPVRRDPPQIDGKMAKTIDLSPVTASARLRSLPPKWRKRLGFLSRPRARTRTRKWEKLAVCPPPSGRGAARGCGATGSVARVGPGCPCRFAPRNIYKGSTFARHAGAGANNNPATRTETMEEERRLVYRVLRSSGALWGRCRG